jgi:ribosomal protein L25 (general stress protein Ctc)
MNEYLAERKLYWPVRAELMASYRDGSHTEEWAHVSLIWKKNSVFHRDGDQPAVIYKDGSLHWYKNGQTHRDGDQPAVIYKDGSLHWYKNGKCHRDGDKPAVIVADSTLLWYKNGLRHRTTGPAVIYSNKKKEYWINGVDITKEVNSWSETRKYTVPFTPEHEVEFVLTFS